MLQKLEICADKAALNANESISSEKNAILVVRAGAILACPWFARLLSSNFRRLKQLIRVSLAASSKVCLSEYCLSKI